MERERVQVVRAVVLPPDANWVHVFGDDGKWRAYRALLDQHLEPDCEYVWIVAGAQTTRRGLEEFREVWLDLLEPWTDFRSEVDELTDLSDRVVMQGRQVARREGIRSDVVLVGTAIFWFHGNKIHRIAFYAEQEEGLEAAGLSH